MSVGTSSQTKLNLQPLTWSFTPTGHYLKLAYSKYLSKLIHLKWIHLKLVHLKLVYFRLVKLKIVNLKIVELKLAN